MDRNEYMLRIAKEMNSYGLGYITKEEIQSRLLNHAILLMSGGEIETSVWRPEVQENHK